MNTIFGHSKVNADLYQKALNEMKVALTQVNEHLKTRSVLVGHKLSIADISLAGSVWNLMKFVVDEK